LLGLYPPAGGGIGGDGVAALDAFEVHVFAAVRGAACVAPWSARAWRVLAHRRSAEEVLGADRQRAVASSRAAGWRRAARRLALEV